MVAIFIEIRKRYWSAIRRNDDRVRFEGGDAHDSHAPGRVGIPTSADIGYSSGFGFRLADTLTTQLDGETGIERGNWYFLTLFGAIPKFAAHILTRLSFSQASCLPATLLSNT